MELSRRKVIEILRKFEDSYDIQFTLSNLIEYHEAKHKSKESLWEMLLSDFDIPN